MLEDVADIGCKDDHWDWCPDDCQIPHTLINKVARSQVAKANRTGRWVEPDDVLQETWLAYWEQRKVVNHLLSLGEDRQAWWLLRDKVYRWCRKEKAALGRFDPAEQHYYARGTLKAFLPSVFGGDVASEGGVSVERPRRTSGAANSGSDLDTMLIDIRWGLHQLTQTDRELLFEAYGHRDSYESGKAKSALTRLQDVLGGPPEAG